MILFTFKNELETRPQPMSCSAFRWTLQLSWTLFGFVHQYRLKEDGTWYDSHTAVYVVELHPTFSIGGVFHAYYDGPHCGLSLGWLRLQWYNANCEKCHAEF